MESYDERLKQFVKENPDLVSVKETSNPDIFVLKYKKKCFYKNIWNEYLENCRGTLIDKDFNIVSLPFTKIYNYGIESRAPRISGETHLTAYRKINGFMVAVTVHNKELLISTTGTIDSDFVQYAKDMIGDKLYSYKDFMSYTPDTTYLFECVHPEDPHIIKEKPGMYLLGYRKKEWNSKLEHFGDNIQHILGSQPVESYSCTLNQLREKVHTVEHEGFVAYTKEGVAFKIKSPYYLVLKAFARKQDIVSLDKSKIDEEYYPLMENIQKNLDEFSALSEQDRLEYIRDFLWKQDH